MDSDIIKQWIEINVYMHFKFDDLSSSKIRFSYRVIYTCTEIISCKFYVRSQNNLCEISFLFFKFEKIIRVPNVLQRVLYFFLYISEFVQFLLQTFLSDQSLSTANEYRSI